MIKKTINFLNKVLGLPYEIVKYVILSIPKVINKSIGYVSSILKAVYKYIKIIVKGIPKVLKVIGKWLIDAVKESIAQIFTLLGFFIAWFTLTGTAQDIVGIAILVSIAVWLLTIYIRED